MELDSKKESSISTPEHKHAVHHVLAQSYYLFLLFFLLGIIFDFIFPINIFKDSTMMPIGFYFIILSSILILWSQRAERNFRSVENVNKETFCFGPYCYTRNPIHWGLFLLMLGFGIMTNAFFIIFFTLFSLAVIKFLFIKKEELILTKKYGAPYIEYKKLVRF